MIKILLIFILSHLIGDFITQTKYVNENKKVFTNSIYSKGLFIHVLHHLIITNLSLLIFGEVSWENFISSILIAVIHYVIDYFKVKKEDKWIQKINNKNAKDKFLIYYLFEKRTTYFLLDQSLHIISIYLLLYINNTNLTLNYIHSQFKIFLFSNTLTMDSDVRIISIFIVLVLVTFTSAYLISNIMEDFREVKPQQEVAAGIEASEHTENINILKDYLNANKVDLIIDESYSFKDEYTIKYQYQKYSEPSKNSRGTYIGIIERLLVVIFIILNVYQGLILLGAMKTLSRFKQFEDKNFAEYYLVGTLLSIILGLCLGFLMNRLF
ncbi:DUF3307 domain-containing protein [Rossellomorea sp. LJF3]|uniref:DUF3307 domain-containing protein n=1 Tax=Rossellomorea sp. LJF3 TaxID=3126099 RepID=UPI00300D9692